MTSTKKAKKPTKKPAKKRIKKREVVINRCWGGYNLSRAAFLRLRELGQKEALAEPDIGEFYEDGSGPRESFCDLEGGFGRDIPRDDPLLVKVVKELGDAANGSHASLWIIKIPSDVKWEIDEYDGMESVQEAHRSWC